MGDWGAFIRPTIRDPVTTVRLAAVGENFVNNVSLVGATTRFWHKD